MGRCWAILACALALSGCGHASDASDASNEEPARNVFIPFVAYTTKLANGFELTTDEDHRAPTIAVNLSYRVGSRDDPPGRSGLAHLVEHLMFRGSRHVPAGDFELRLHGAAATWSAVTDLDRTWFSENIPSDQLALTMWLESDRMLSGLETIDEATLAAEREVVKSEARFHASDTSDDDVLGLAQTAVFPEGHPYHHRPIGTAADIDRITLNDAKDFARRFYVPSNATLAIVGDIDRNEVAESVEHWFGTLAKNTPPVRVNPALVPLPKLTGVTHLEVEADIEHAQVIVSWPGPRRYGQDDAEVDEYFDFLGRVLQAWLVIDDTIARSVAAVRRRGELGSHDALVFTLAPGAKPEDAVVAIDKLLVQTRRTRMSPHDVDDERRGFTARLIYQLEGFDDRARDYNDFRDATGRAIFAQTWFKQYDAVRASSARRLPPAWFPENARVITIVRPVKGAPIAGRLVSKR
jgi:zinc protease